MIRDRRKGIERRTAVRRDVTIDIEWQGRSGTEKGVLADVSEKGCFVLGSGNVEDGDMVEIFVPVSDEVKVQFSGEVINHVLDIGFGMKFVGINSAQQDLLHKIIASSSERG